MFFDLKLFSGFLGFYAFETLLTPLRLTAILALRLYQQERSICWFGYERMHADDSKCFVFKLRGKTSLMFELFKGLNYHDYR